MVEPFVALLTIVLVLVLIWVLYRDLTPRALPRRVVTVDGPVTSAPVDRTNCGELRMEGLSLSKWNPLWDFARAVTVSSQ